MRTLTPQDCHALMNLLVKEATGQDASIQVVDSSSFVSAGETVLATGKENVLNSLSIVLGRSFMAVRPYKAKMMIIQAINSGVYASRLRKISLYSREATESGDYNTQLNTNFMTGYDNGTNGGQSTASMWEQNLPVALEMNFSGKSVWEESTTIFEDQIAIAFRGEAEFAEFVAAIMTEKGNDIESRKEAFNRMTLLNHIAGVYDLSASMPKSAVNLTTEFNNTFGTSYTSEQLRTTYLADFLKFFVSRFKLDSDYMENRSANYHWTPTKVGYSLLRHTPKAKQKAVLYSPLFLQAQAYVYPEIFNPSYLDINTQYEGVTYWQNINDPAAISVTPAIPDVNGSGSQTTGDNVSIPYVVGMLFDEDAIMVDYQLEASNTTPLEARKRFRNLWWTFARNAINDFSENAIIYYMAD